MVLATQGSAGLNAAGLRQPGAQHSKQYAQARMDVEMAVRAAWPHLAEAGQEVAQLACVAVAELLALALQSSRARTPSSACSGTPFDAGVHEEMQQRRACARAQALRLRK